MAYEDNGVNRCCFQWEIREPFIPWKARNAHFFDGTADPDPIRWKATIQPLVRNRNRWAFLFYISCDTFYEVYEARDVTICIRYNAQLLVERTGFDVVFLPGGRHVYSIEATAQVYPRMQRNVLDVLIRLHLPGSVERNFFPDHIADTTGLSNDLKRLLNNPSYTNLTLKSNNSNLVFRVHSYIIRARWNNFFRVHNIPPDSIEVRIDVKYNVLRDILTYIYSGIINEGWPDWEDISYVNQIFSVIFRYNVYHLYKVLVNNDEEQKRETSMHVFSNSFIVPRFVLLGLPIDTNIARHINDGGYNFTFELQLCRIHNNPSLSYSLKSRSRRIIFVQVNLQIVITAAIGVRYEFNFPEVWSQHHEDHTLNPFAELRYGPFLNLESHALFGNLHPLDIHGQPREIEHSIRCNLKYTDGREINQISSVASNTQTYLERCRILCDHMEVLIDDEFEEADFQINVPQGLYFYTTFKAIFTARVANWRAVFQNPEPARIGKTILAELLLNEAIPYVLKYICTGRCIIPQVFLDGVENFAIRGDCSTLLDLVYRIRMESVNMIEGRLN